MDSAKIRKILSVIAVIAIVIIVIYNSGILGGGNDPSDQQDDNNSTSSQTIGDADNTTQIVSQDDQGQIGEPNGQDDQGDQSPQYIDYCFRSNKLLTQHYEKHGIEMGFDSKESYEKAASDVINNPAALHKTEAEDGDYVYYIEETNEFVILSQDGYIRTYFLPSAGKAYYDRQ
ncbi:MAG: hypothetical protein K6E85_01990 [Lachnospiraceae bacterium]|nr:hypothetical protein [Lachnospiraceae bacterium]